MRHYANRDIFLSSYVDFVMAVDKEIVLFGW